MTSWLFHYKRCYSSKTRRKLHLEIRVSSLISFSASFLELLAAFQRPSFFLSLSLFFSTFLFLLPFVVTYPPCRHTLHSVQSLSHTDSTLSILPFTLLSSFHPLCAVGVQWREREGQKKKSSQLVSLSLSVCPLPFALLHFPAVGLLQTHAHASHPSPAMSIPRCCMVDLGCLSYCRKGDTLKCAVLVH